MDNKRTLLLLFPGDSSCSAAKRCLTELQQPGELLPAAPAQAVPGAHGDFVLLIRRCQRAPASLRTWHHTPALLILVNSPQAVKD